MSDMFIAYRTCALVIRFSGKQNKVVTTMTTVVIITKDMQDYKSMPQESRLHEFCLPLYFGPTGRQLQRAECYKTTKYLS
jgi:hypothetical protein